MPYCPRCGVQLDAAGARFCRICGTSLLAPIAMAPAVELIYVPSPAPSYAQRIYYEPQMIAPMRMKSTTIAAASSVLLPGIGQIYAGRALRGLGILALLVLIGLTGYIVFRERGLWLTLPSLLGIFAWQIYDAYHLAGKYNEYTRLYSRPPW